MDRATRAASSSDGGAGHADFDEFGRAFAVADDLMGEVAHHPGQRGLERLQRRGPSTAAAVECAGGGDQQRVGGGGVAVHRDGVEGRADMARDHASAAGPAMIFASVKM